MSELEKTAAAAVASWERDGANYATFCQRMDALRDALAAHKQAEPVAWIPRDHLRQARFGPFLCRVEPTQRRPDFVALYTAPPAPQQAEPVVDKELTKSEPEVDKEQASLRDLLISAAAMAVVAVRQNAYEGAAWVADAVLEDHSAEQAEPVVESAAEPVVFTDAAIEAALAEWFGEGRNDGSGFEGRMRAAIKAARDFKEAK